MTTSTRVYMFALAVADSMVCVCSCLVLSVGLTDFMTMLAFTSIISASLTFSMFLLVFVSIERLVAVKRPHTFSMNPRRAKKYIIIIVVVATIFTTLTTVAMLMGYDKFIKIACSCMSVSCTLILITCYTLMAAALLKKVRVSRNQVGVLSVTRSSQPETSRAVIARVDYATRGNYPGSSNISMTVKANEESNARTSVPVTGINKITNVNQANAFKNVLMLCIITIVFLACWVPVWLSYMDVYMSTVEKRSIMVNSAVNPFIYGVASSLFREDVRQFYRLTRVKLCACCL
ncbi:hypothetical protein LSAT2_007985 [Lamellibrachia satsuma]|nr:hypothetical protein LSAT2_007985 [Lamellibrachia satsuma]